MARSLFACLIVAVVLCLATAAAPKVPHLNKKNFDATVSDGKVHFIKFYAPWCGHCKRLAPTWAKLRGETEGDDRVSVESVDCTKNRKVCDKAKVGGFPTLKVYYKGEAVETFRESRELGNLKAFLGRHADALLGGAGVEAVAA